MKKQKPPFTLRDYAQRYGRVDLPEIAGIIPDPRRRRPSRHRLDTPEQRRRQYVLQKQRLTQ